MLRAKNHVPMMRPMRPIKLIASRVLNNVPYGESALDSE